MKLTNKLKLPQPIVDAVANDSYSPGHADITVTRLLQPPQLRVLAERHGDQITEDVSDRIWSLFGQTLHTILERAATTGISEERFYTEIDGIVLGGQFDHLSITDNRLIDYKMTSAWAVVFGKAEWEQQLNCLDYLLTVNNYEDPNRKLGICAFLRDWNKNEAARNSDYPQLQVAMIPVKRWSVDEQKAFITHRLNLHWTDPTPDCSDEERWYTGDKWAVYKDAKAKRAMRLLDTEMDAKAYIRNKGGSGVIKFRRGQYRRCENYCAVAPFCPTWKASEEELVEQALARS